MRWVHTVSPVIMCDQNDILVRRKARAVVLNERSVAKDQISTVDPEHDGLAIGLLRARRRIDVQIETVLALSWSGVSRIIEEIFFPCGRGRAIVELLQARRLCRYGV